MLKITNLRTNLNKIIDTSKYTFEEVDEIIVFYNKIGWKVTYV
jgi:hypothetical protein